MIILIRTCSAFSLALKAEVRVMQEVQLLTNGTCFAEEKKRRKVNITHKRATRRASTSRTREWNNRIKEIWRSWQYSRSGIGIWLLYWRRWSYSHRFGSFFIPRYWRLMMWNQSPDDRGTRNVFPPFEYSRILRYCTLALVFPSAFNFGRRMTPTSEPRDSCSSIVFPVLSVNSFKNKTWELWQWRKGRRKLSGSVLTSQWDLYVLFEAWSGSCTRVSFLRWRIGRVRCGDGMALVLSAEPCYDEDPESFRDLWDAFGRLFAVGKGVDVGAGDGSVGFFRRILIRSG